MPLEVTIVADGQPVSRSSLARLRRGRFTIALDGAAERAQREGWVPELVAGDFDSVKRSTLRALERKGTALLPLPDQHFTDLEKTLAWCRLRDARSIWVAQALGNRPDHAFANLALLKRFHQPGRELVLFQEKERVFFARDEKLRLRGKKGRLFALLPFPACRARSRGLAYELKGEALALGVRESVANRAKGAEVRLAIEGEAVVVEGI